jgi:hypothetical protein
MIYGFCNVWLPLKQVKDIKHRECNNKFKLHTLVLRVVLHAQYDQIGSYDSSDKEECWLNDSKLMAFINLK